MRSRGWGRSVWVAALLLPTAACGVGPSGRPVPGGQPPAAVDVTQADYVLEIQRDQQSLDRGLLVHTDLRALNVGDETEFQVTVFDLGKASEAPQPAPTAAPSLPPGLVASTKNVPTGGSLSVGLACTHLACTADDSARKPVVGRGSSASWSFGVSAHEVGAAHLHLTAQVYRADTDQVLQEVSVDLDVPVRRTWSYTASQALDWLLTTAPGLGLFSGGMAAGAAGGVWRWLRARRRQSDVERVLAAIPRADELDRLLFGLLHATGRPVREVLGIQLGSLRLDRRAVSIAFPGPFPGPGGEGPVVVRIADRRTARLVRRGAAGRAGGRLLVQGDGEQLSLPVVEQRWQRHCSRLGLDLPLGALGT